MLSRSLAWLTSLLLLVCAASAAEPERDIFVPFDQLSVLLEGPTRRMLLSREEYEQLLERAKARTPAELRAPSALVLLSANYDVQVEAGRAVVAGVLEVDSLADGVHALPLDLRHVGIEQATLDGRPAPIGRGDDGVLRLFVEGRGRKQLRLRLLTPLETNAAQQSLRMAIAHGATTRMSLVVPGNVEIKQGVAVASRQVDEAAGITRFELLPPPGEIQLAMTLNNRQQRQQRIVLGRGVVIDELTGAYERLQATFSLTALHRAVDRFRIAVPSGFEIVRAEAPQLARWTIEPAAAGATVLDVQLRQATTDRVVLQVVAARNGPPPADWRFPQLKPLDVEGYTGVVGLRLDENWKADAWQFGGVIPIGTSELDHIQSTADGGNSARLRAVAAGFVPGAEFDLRAALSRPAASTVVYQTQTLEILESQLTWSGTIVLTAEHEPQAEFDVLVPTGWQVTHITSGQQPLRHERYPAADGSSRYRVALREAIGRGGVASVEIAATNTPAGWLGSWKQQDIPLPRVQVSPATRETGELSVHARDDFTVRPKTTTNLIPVAAPGAAGQVPGQETQLLYRYDSAPFDGVVTVERVEPRLTARTYTFWSVDEDVVQTHVELVYDVQQARVGELTFLLPKEAPADLTIRGLDGLAIKETSTTLVETGRRVVVTLADRRRGALRLAVDFPLRPAEAADKTVPLPAVKAEGVAYQSGVVAVEGSADLDVQIVANPPKVDVGQLAGADYVPGRRLLGAFGFVGDQSLVTVKRTRHPTYGLPPAIVQEGLFATMIGPNGHSQTAADFALRAKVTFLELELPIGSDGKPSRLWSAQLDGAPIKPQREGQRLLVNLPVADARTLRHLVVMYETAIPELAKLKELSLPSARLLLRGVKGAASEVPMATSRWEVYLPHGYEIARSRGTLSPTSQTRGPELAAWRVGEGLLVAMNSSVFPTLATARDHGRMSIAMTQPTASPYYLADDVKNAVEEPYSIQLAAPADSKSGMAGEAKLENESIRPGMQPPLAKSAASTAAGADNAPANPQAAAMPKSAPVSDKEMLELRRSESATTRISGPADPRGGSKPADEKSNLGKLVDGVQRQEGLGDDRKRMSAPLNGAFGANRAKPDANQPVPKTELRVDVGEVNVFKSRGVHLSAQLPGDALGESAAIAESYRDAQKQLFSRLAGVRSLQIDLQRFGQAIAFESLGVEPRLDVTVVDRRGVGLLGRAMALLVLLFGLFLLARPWKQRLRFVAAVCLLATVIPLVSGWFELATLFNPSFYAACWLLLIYAAVACLRGCCRLCAACCSKCCARWRCPMAAKATVVLLAVGLVVGGGVQTARAQLPIDPREPLTIEIERPTVPVTVPDNALIWLFEAPKGLELPKAERVLVPYDQYQTLWGRAYPERLPKPTPPAPFALAGASYRATLADDVALVVQGRIEVQLFGDASVDVPLSLENGVLSEATVDGQPARLKVVVPLGAAPAAANMAPPMQMAQAVKPVAPAKPLTVLVMQGEGRHIVELRVRLGLRREGGWRVVEGQLPTPAATALALTAPTMGTELRLSGISDRRSHETTRDAEILTTALTPGESFRLAWRPKLQAAQIDQSLQANSRAVFSQQEDGWRLAWTLDLAFRGQPREFFTIIVPADALVDRIEGGNVRGWEARDADGARQIEITLLRPAVDAERIVVYLSQRTALAEAPRDVVLPLVAVRDASLQQGEATIERGRTVALRTSEATGATRIDLSGGAPPAATFDSGDRSPLGVELFEAYRFSSVPFRLVLSAGLQSSPARAELRSIVRLGDRDAHLESNLTWHITGRARYLFRAKLPVDWRVEQVSAAPEHEWSVLKGADGQTVEVLFKAGQQGAVSLTLLASLQRPANSTAVALPRVEALDSDSQETEIVVQADPAYRVETADLVGCESVLLDRMAAWLTPQQRALGQVALRSTVSNYGGTLNSRRRASVVTCTVVSSLRVTSRAFEETVLLDYTVRDAGVRRIAFLLPEALREARIRAPLLQSKQFEPVAGQPGLLRVRLELRDEVLGDFRVLIENDRLRDATSQTLPLPVVEEAQVIDRFALLEATLDSEVVVKSHVGLEPLTRQQTQWQRLAGLLQMTPTEAYRVQTGAVDPQLVYALQERARVETVKARIGLAEARLVIDPHGAYRSVQTYRIDNQTEQFLDLDLPAGAQLWSVWVADEPVKPIEAGAGAPAGRIRVPLVKTTPGELDYLVIVKFGGRVPKFGLSPRIDFPFIRTVNIDVDRSQVQLYLPEDFRWYGFEGSLGRVDTAGEYAENELLYYNRVTQRLSQLANSADDFTKIRALNSYSELSRQLDVNPINTVDNPTLQRELSSNRRAIEAVQQQQEQFGLQRGAGSLGGGQRVNEPPVSLRGAIEQRFNTQQIQSSRESIDNLGNNFDAGRPVSGEKAAAAKLPATTASGFGVWYEGNGLQLRDGKEEKGAERKKELSTAGDAKPMTPPASKSPAPAERSQKGSKVIASPMIENRPAAPAGPQTGRPSAPTQQPAQPGKDADEDVAAKYQQRLVEQLKAKQEVDRRSDRLAGEVQNADGFVALGLAKGGELPQGQTAAVVVDRNAAALASLDVEIPARGTLYRFTTPRGNLELKARGVSSPLVDGLTRLAAVLAVVLAVVAVLKFCTHERMARCANSWIFAAALGVVGFGLLLIGFLGLLGLLMIVASVVLFARRLWFRNRVKA